MDISRIQQYIEKNHLFTLNDKLLVTVSGGPDSVALLYVLNKYGYDIEAAHCNFHLRGDESDRDEAFVSRLCEKMKVKLHISHFNTLDYAKEHHLSIEMAARELRYEWFEKLRLQIGAQWIAVAHHRDDSNETMLLNLMRGTGINGLLGIRPKNGCIVRPLLCISRDDIIEILNNGDLQYVTDSTNAEDEFKRNKVRLHIIPLMQTINPSVKEALSQTAEHLAEAADIYNKVIAEGKKNVVDGNNINIEKLKKEPSPHALLFEILYPLGFVSSQIDELLTALNGQPGKIFESSGWIAVKDRNKILIQKKEENAQPQLEIRRVERTKDFIIPRNADIACVDADLIKEPLTIRKWQKGDRFIPFGMSGSKLVSNYLTDKKQSLLQKNNQWIVCSGTNIVWLVDERSDNRYRVTNKTKNMLLITIKRQ